MADARLRAVRIAYRGKRDGDRDLGYTAYVVGFGALVAVVPVVRILFLTLTTPQALGALDGSSAPAVTAVVAGASLALLCLFGAVRGPAHYPPFLALVLMESDLPHYRVLRRPFAFSTLWVAIIAALVGAVPGIALIFSRAISFERSAPLVIGGAAFGIIASVVWAWGQRLGRTRAWMLSAAIGVAVLVTVLAPTLSYATPWGWVGKLYPTATPTEIWPLVALIALAVLAVFAARPLLDGISAGDLVDQSKRWESASSAVISGDPSLALSTFRPLPSIGRSWNAVAPRLPLSATFWWRDLIGASRTPVRFTFSTIGLIASGAVLTIAGLQGDAGWLAGAVGAFLAFMSLGSLSDGLRHAAEAYGAPQLYGLSRDSLLRHHSSLPLTCAILMMLFGGTICIVLGAPAAGLGVSAAVAVIVFLIRVFDSAKGPLSPALLAPIPTPVGDLSGTVVLAWEADAALLVTAAGALAAFALYNGGGMALIATSVVTGATVIVLCVRRFRRL